MSQSSPLAISEQALSTSQIFTQEVVSDGSGPLTVTIAWTDPPGMAFYPWLNPENKTLVNGQDGHGCVLQDGDRIEMGNVTLVFHVGSGS